MKHYACKFTSVDRPTMFRGRSKLTPGKLLEKPVLHFLTTFIGLVKNYKLTGLKETLLGDLNLLNILKLNYYG